MSKKTITVELYRCDHVEGEKPCPEEGNRLTIKECTMCKKDLCNRHYAIVSVETTKSRMMLTYIFCFEHADEFIQAIVGKFGDPRQVVMVPRGALEEVLRKMSRGESF